MTRVLSANRLMKNYGGRGQGYPALRGVDLEVREGEFLGIMGPSGSGKTTLLNVLSTVDAPSSGSISYRGTDVLRLRGKELAAFRRERLGFVFQDFNLLDTLTASENVALPLALSGAPAATQREKALTALSRLGIGELGGRFPWEMSGGQRQRVACARAIVASPDLVFADEPTGNLDSRSAREFLSVVESLNSRDGTTVLIVTHDAFAASFCSRIVLLRDGLVFGELASSGDRAEFFDRVIDSLRALEGGKK